MPVRGRLVLDEHVNVAVSGGGLQAVKDIAEVLPQIILYERARLQLQGAEVAERAQLCREMKLHKVPGNLRLREKLPESRVVRRGRAVFLLHPC